MVHWWSVHFFSTLNEFDFYKGYSVEFNSPVSPGVSRKKTNRSGVKTTKFEVHGNIKKCNEL